MVRNRPEVAYIHKSLGKLRCDRPTVQLDRPPSLLRKNSHARPPKRCVSTSSTKRPCNAGPATVAGCLLLSVLSGLGLGFVRTRPQKDTAARCLLYQAYNGSKSLLRRTERVLLSDSGGYTSNPASNSGAKTTDTPCAADTCSLEPNQQQQIHAINSLTLHGKICCDTSHTRSCAAANSQVAGTHSQPSTCSTWAAHAPFTQMRIQIQSLLLHTMPTCQESKLPLSAKHSVLTTPCETLFL
jgi:hypothetical protein